MPQPSAGRLRFGLTTYCSCPGSAPAPTCCREEKSGPVLLRCCRSWLAAAGAPALCSGGGDRAGGTAGGQALLGRRMRGGGVEGGAAAASPALLGLRLQAARLGCSRGGPPHRCPWWGRPRLGHGSRVRCPDWQEGWSLEASSSPTPPHCVLESPSSIPRCMGLGRLVFTRPSMVFFFQWEPRIVLIAAAITRSLGNFPASSYFVNNCLALRWATDASAQGALGGRCETTQTRDSSERKGSVTWVEME